MEKRLHPYLEELILTAQAAGYNISSTSSYRSFETQVETFNYWVDWNQNVFGYDRAKALTEANRISAIPGFSEHQLGTTVDLNATECNAFEGYCGQNEALWTWLDQNDSTYGFVLSYPEGTEEQSGYRFEPWHYRWIGIENMNSYENSGMILRDWLETL